MKHRFLVWLLSIVFSAATLSAQDAYMLKGVVQDEAGEPLIGATVMVKGTTQGVATDIDGNFAVNVKKGQTIDVSYVGYDAQSIKVNGQNNITVVMKENSSTLDDLVVVGYGVQKKSDVTGSVTSVGKDRLSKLPVTNVLQAMQGATSGVTITQ